MFLMKIVWKLWLGKLHFVQGIFRPAGIDLFSCNCILCRLFVFATGGNLRVVLCCVTRWYFSCWACRSS